MTIVSFSKGTGALNTISQIQKSEGLRTTSISKISSSLKIRKASDAVADSAIGTKLKVEVESLKQLLIGTAQAKAALEIAEGGLSEITKTLTRMNTLAMSAKNGVYKAEEVEKINQEFVALIDEIDRISKATNFNSKQLLSGTETVIKDSFDNTNLGEDLRDGNLSSEQGFESIIIDNSKTNTAYRISYDQQSRLLKVTNTNDPSKYDAMKVSSDTIRDGQLETVVLSKLGVTIKLNHNFDKNRSIGTDYDHMMNPALNNDNLKNLELMNTISTTLLEKDPDIATLPKFTATQQDAGTDTFRIAGETNNITLPTTTDAKTVEKWVYTGAGATTEQSKIDGFLQGIQTAFALKTPATGSATVIKVDATKAGELNDEQLELINSSTETETLNITSVSWDTGFTGGDAGATNDAEIHFNTADHSLTAYKMTDFDHETGTVYFEAKVGIEDTTATTTNKTTATVTGSFQLDKGYYANGFRAIDYTKQSIVKDPITGDAEVLKGGTYKLKDNDIVAYDGFVYDKTTGDKVLTLPNDRESTVQLKLDNNHRTDDVSIARISNNATDLTSFDVKIKGTNGKAILYIEAQNGTFQSEELNLTDIEYNDGYKDDGSYEGTDDNSSYIAKTKLTRGQVKLSRIITNGQREDSIVINLNKLRTDGLIKLSGDSSIASKALESNTLNIPATFTAANIKVVDSADQAITTIDATAFGNSKDLADVQAAINKRVAELNEWRESLIKGASAKALASLEAGFKFSAATLEGTALAATPEFAIKLSGAKADYSAATGTDSTTAIGVTSTNVDDNPSDIKIKYSESKRDDAYKNNVFLTLNELKNTVVAYQQSSDKTNLSFQVGTGSGEQNSIKVTIDSITSARLNLIDASTGKKLELTTDQDKLQDIISTVQAAIDIVQTVRSEVAVGDNRINVADSSIQTSITNSQAAVSAIFDLDIPEEMVELSQSEMMEQSSIEALAREMRAKQNLMKLF